MKVLDGVVIVAALILNPRMHKRRKREAAERAEAEAAAAALPMQTVEHETTSRAGSEP